MEILQWLVRILIFSEFDAQYHLASYFNNLSFEICEEDVEVFYEKSTSLELK